MLKVFILVISLNDGSPPTEIAAYDTLGDCLDVAHTLHMAGVSLPVQMYCEESAQ